MDNKKGISKGIIIGAIAAVVVIVIGIVAALFLFKKDKAYRLIKVFEIDGKTTVTREKKGDIDAYANMILESGDNVFVEQGKTTLKLDDDKFVYAEENSRFELIATGNSQDSKTTINLLQGAITNEIQNKLSNNSNYEINTQNSNMAVKGTIYRVYTYVDEDGVYYTKVSVFKGKVATKLIYADGSMADEEVMVEGGKEVIIYENPQETNYLTEPQDIDYSDLPGDVVAWLIEKIKDEGLDIGIPIDDLIEIYDIIVGKAHTVTFMYNGMEFGTQIVEDGDVVSVPGLVPALSGNWDYDFSKPVTEDIVINWK